MRGHGLTTCTPGPYSIEGLADDLFETLRVLGVGKAHIGGVSIGGLIAQAFALAHPEAVASLILVDTALSMPPAQPWFDRAAHVRANGLKSIEDMVIARWVTPGFLDAPETAGLRAMLTRTPDEGYAAGCEAVGAADFTATTLGLKVPALVVVGAEDPATPVAAAEALHEAIAESALVVLENAAHIPQAEQPAALTAAIAGFLRPAITDYYEAGMGVRKQVLGEAHVARASANITDLDRDFQAFITRTAWGGVWTRPGLDRRTRSLLTIAMMASLGHEEELKLHLRASKNTGATPADIAEVLMQVAVYGGVPAANSAFRHAKDIFKEIYP
jgi:3-oxoadipate enol-lactonase/4-carboxymuconolactone decarboxylase